MFYKANRYDVSTSSYTFIAIPFGRSNYVGVFGVDPAWSPGNGRNYRESFVETDPTRGVVIGQMHFSDGSLSGFGGVFGADSKIGYREMTDGSSHCFVLGERYSPDESKLPPKNNVIGAATWVGTMSSGGDSMSSVLGEASFPINFHFTVTYPLPGTTGFGSAHRGGAHFLFGDGAVRFINQTIDMDTFRKLARISDGSSVGEF